jgi:protease-4
MDQNPSSFGRRLALVVVLASILLFSGLGYLYYSGRGVAAGNLVGVIHVDGDVTSSETASIVTAAINDAISNMSIKAVVVRIDSPGGFAHLIEQIYLDLLELKQRKPVVASAVTALSGGYYIAVAADYIYAHPSSMIGNVGVIGVGPENLLPSEVALETGPYKATGFSKLLFPFNLTHALDSFAGAVESGRGARLELSSLELRRGMIYIGNEAVRAGLVDEIGSLQRAAEHAAAEAGIRAYRVVDILPGAETAGVATSYPNGTGLMWRDMTVATLNRINPPPAIYYLYLPLDAFQTQETVTTTTEQLGAPPPQATGKGQMIVDLSHGNKVSPWIFNLLSAELAMRGVYVGYGETWDDVEKALNSSACLVVAAPTEPYSKDEYRAIERFVNQGRILLMLFDPSAEFIDEQALLGPVNSLANRYGLTFGKGYLYNEGDNYGLYRNIYVRSFRNSSLTKELEAIVLFTATFVHSTDSDAAWTPRDTYASVAERGGRYAPISVIEKGNGTIAAIGDITFLVEPWAYVEDNRKLMMNIVSAVSEIEVPIVEEPEEEEPELNVTEPDLPIGTAKLYDETVDGKESEVWWVRTGENEARVDREDTITIYSYDEEGNLVGWRTPEMEQAYDPPLPGLPYPLVEAKAWAYAVTYNLTIGEEQFNGTIEGKGKVTGFEELEIAMGKRYLCAKVSMSERDELPRPEDTLTTVSTELLWVSHDGGLIRAETEISYYVDDQLAFEETRVLMLKSINIGEGVPP